MRPWQSQSYALNLFFPNKAGKMRDYETARFFKSIGYLREQVLERKTGENAPCTKS